MSIGFLATGCGWRILSSKIDMLMFDKVSNMFGSVSAESDTKLRIIEVAERLFAQRFPRLTSVRAITGEAGVNAAAVHYHFGGRAGLFRAVAERHLEPIRAAQLARLEGLEGAAAVDIEQILAAFIAPMLDGFARNPVLQGLIGLVATEPDLVGTVEPAVWGSAPQRFQLALARALPHLTPDEIQRRFSFTTGVVMKVMLSRRGILVTGVPEGTDVADVVAFTAAGLRARSTLRAVASLRAGGAEDSAPPAAS
jgi:AcrR family transcriptional regulator